jgi:putative membrane protein
MPMKNNVIIKNILYILQGALVGIGAILPGVSGGVLCVAFGIYEPMMELLTHPLRAIKKNYKMFIPFIIGWIVGFIVLAGLIEALFASFASIALMLFFGLICGTLPELFKSSELADKKKSWTPLVLSLAVAYFVFHIVENGVSTTIEPSFFGFLFCGILWGLSLIIPGFSSSSILIYIGLFEPMTAGLAALDMAVVLPMLLGIALIALLLARVVYMLFKKKYAIMSRIVLGFVIASTLKIIPSAFKDGLELAISVVCFALGFAVARIMDVKGSKIENESQNTSIEVDK